MACARLHVWNFTSLAARSYNRNYRVSAYVRTCEHGVQILFGLVPRNALQKIRLAISSWGLFPHTVIWHDRMPSTLRGQDTCRMTSFLLQALACTVQEQHQS